MMNADDSARLIYALLMALAAGHAGLSEAVAMKTLDHLTTCLVNGASPEIVTKAGELLWKVTRRDIDPH